MTSDTAYNDLPLLCPLTRCILEGNTDVLKRMLRKRKKNPTTLQANSKGWTALHFAAFNDEHADCLKLLLSNKDTLRLNLDADTINGETAFFLACAEGCVKNFRILLDSQCNPEIRNGCGYTPLHIASIRGRASIVSQLIAHGWDPNCLATVKKITPLHYASRWGNVDVVRVLMTSKRTRVNICTTDGKLPLHYACIWGSLEIVRILVEADCRLMDGRCNKGFTPLRTASTYGHSECVKYLLKQGAIANHCVSGHETILSRVVKNGNKEMVDLVLQATSPTYVSEQFMLEIKSFLSTDQRTFHSLLTYGMSFPSSELMLLLLESGMPKGILESPYIRYGHVYSPLAYLFYAAIYFNHTQDEVDKRFRLLLQHKITHMYEFTRMVELKEVFSKITLTMHYKHPFTYILRGPWSPMQRYHYLITLLEYGIITDYSLQCDVHYDSRFQDFDANVLERFYRPVVLAILEDNAVFIELLLANSAILEPSHLWNFLQYRRRFTMENPRNVVNYLIDLGVTVDTSNLPLYPFGGTIKCPNLQQLCRQAIRKHLRDVTLQENLKNFKQKISALPLRPNSLKNYLNFKRR